MNAVVDGKQQQQRFEVYLVPIFDAAYGMALHMTRLRGDAEDVVLDAAVQEFRAFHQVQEGTNFKAWLRARGKGEFHDPDRPLHV